MSGRPDRLPVQAPGMLLMAARWGLLRQLRPGARRLLSSGWHSMHARDLEELVRAAGGELLDWDARTSWPGGDGARGPAQALEADWWDALLEGQGADEALVDWALSEDILVVGEDWLVAELMPDVAELERPGPRLGDLPQD